MSPNEEPPRGVGVAVVGCGAWGRNLVRTFHALPGSRLLAVCDIDEARLVQMRSQFPDVPATRDFSVFGSRKSGWVTSSPVSATPTSVPAPSAPWERSASVRM